MITFRATIVNIFYALTNANSKYHVQKNAFIYSTEGRSPLLATQVNNNRDLPYRVVGFLTTNKKKKGINISGQKVHYFADNLDKLAMMMESKNIRYIIFSSDANFRREKGRLVELCLKHHITMLMAGQMQDIENGVVPRSHIKEIEMEDVLGREEIDIDMDAISAQLADKTILITGAAGSIGSEIAKQVCTFKIKKLVLFDNAETPLHNLQLELRKRYPNLNVHFILGDVRSMARTEMVFESHQPQVIFHAAAYKHVPLVEDNPCEAIMVNVMGSTNVAKCAIKHGADKFVMVSTDKAVNPTNVMGASKRIAEMSVQRLNQIGCTTKFITTRFGNVLGSNGSVIPLFKKQILSGGPITVTHPDIIRYFMTIPEACRLVLQAASMGKGGEIYVFDMGEQVRIADLARRMISLYGLKPDEDIKITYTGLRPGEKLYEELLNDQENTLPTPHHKIKVAKVRLCDVDILEAQLEDLIAKSTTIDVMGSVQVMKDIVPEFISNNSRFSELDKN